MAVKSGIKAGLQRGAQVYKGAYLAPNSDADWDSYEARLFRVVHYWHYYNNTAYSTIQRYAPQLIKDKDLYAFIRGIYNPVNRLVFGYVANVWGGNLDMEALTGGAIPLDGIDDVQAGAIRQLWRWSNWQTKKGLVVRRGAVVGFCPIKVRDDRKSRKVRLEVQDPAIVADADFDSVGNVDRIVYAYMRRDPDTDRDFLYSEEINDDFIATYRDGDLWGYPENVDGAGRVLAKWKNPYGFCPVVMIPHIDIGKKFPANAFHAQLGKIDEANDLASKLADYMRKAVDPVWFFAGPQGATDLEFADAEDRDDVPGMFGPEGSTATALVAPVDLAGALEVLRDQLKEIERDLPELALARIREQGEMTAPGVRAGFSDAINRYVEARGNYDEGLVRAQMMAMSIGGHNGYEGFEAFDLDSYRLGTLEHSIKERPVVEDALTLKEQIEALQASGAPEWLIWQRAGVSEEEATKAYASKQASDRTLAAQFGAAIANGGGNPVVPVDEGAI